MNFITHLPTEGNVILQGKDIYGIIGIFIFRAAK